jgi:hypothetical protein
VNDICLGDIFGLAVAASFHFQVFKAKKLLIAPSRFVLAKHHIHFSQINFAFSSPFCFPGHRFHPGINHPTAIRPIHQLKRPVRRHGRIQIEDYK